MLYLQIPPRFGFLGLLVLALLVFLLVFIPASLLAVSFDRLGLNLFEGAAAVAAMVAWRETTWPAWGTGRLVRVPTEAEAALRGMFFAFTGQTPGPTFDQAPGGGELVELRLGCSVGGLLTPLALCAWVLAHAPEAAAHWQGLALCLLVTAGASYAAARPWPGVGMRLPMLVPPVVAALAAWVIVPGPLAPAAALVSGCLGAPLGAQVLPLLLPGQRERIEAAEVALGGRGVFGAVLLSALLAGVLAGGAAGVAPAGPLALALPWIVPA
ncbi:MAG: DUF1614 domain-containing protein [Desulfovibrionaceae bacterium]